MRVAMLHWAFPPIIGGVESHLAMLGPELVWRGHEVFLLTGSVGGREEEYSYRGVRVKRTPLMDLNTLNPRAIEEKAEDIRKELHSFIAFARPDVIHAHNMHYFSPVHAQSLLEAAGRRGVPAVLTAHNVWDDGLWKDMLAYAGRWDAVIAVSRYIKNELAAAGYPASRLTVVYHGIDTARFNKPEAGEEKAALARCPELAGRRVIFHPARMSLDKGCHISVLALDLIRKSCPDVLLVLAGPEKTVDWGRHQEGHVNFIGRLVRDLRLESHVLVRFFDWEDMPYIYRAAELCVYPSCFQEPFGLVMLESLACGRPIVVSRAGGMPEIISDGVNGYVVEMGDYEMLARRCVHLLENRLAAGQMGERGRQMVRQKFTKEIMCANTLEVYRRVLAGAELEIAS